MGAWGPDPASGGEELGLVEGWVLSGRGNRAGTTPSLCPSPAVGQDSQSPLHQLGFRGLFSYFFICN